MQHVHTDIYDFISDV